MIQSLYIIIDYVWGSRGFPPRGLQGQSPCLQLTHSTRHLTLVNYRTRHSHENLYCYDTYFHLHTQPSLFHGPDLNLHHVSFVPQCTHDHLSFLDLPLAFHQYRDNTFASLSILVSIWSVLTRCGSSFSSSHVAYLHEHNTLRPLDSFSSILTIIFGFPGVQNPQQRCGRPGTMNASVKITFFPQTVWQN